MNYNEMELTEGADLQAKTPGRSRRKANILVVTAIQDLNKQTYKKHTHVFSTSFIKKNQI